MKIAISATGDTLEAYIDQRFGRCKYFIIANPQTLEYESLDNSEIAGNGGAGIKAAQLVCEQGVEAVITGSCGPNASEVLNAAGIKIITNTDGQIKTALQNFQKGIRECTPPSEM
nr:NifB/NifX family molybdenum-iron cluster-binding protein [Dehalococcoides mccartyi]